MSRQPNSAQDWAPVESGQLQSLSSKLRRQESRGLAVTAGKTFVGCAAAVLLAGLAFKNLAGLDRPLPGAPAAIACSQVVPQLQLYVDGGCDPELAERIAAHLDYCDMCRDKYLKLTEAQAASVTSKPPHHDRHAIERYQWLLAYGSRP